MLINKELFEKYFKKDDKKNFANVDIHMISTLNKWVSEGRIKTTKQKTFTFAYYWLISYLWKYGKYGEQMVSIKEIKMILGLSPIDKRMNYIVKKDGLLDREGYSETTKDFPIHSSFGEHNIELTMLSDLDEHIQKEMIKEFGKNYSVKKPLLMLQRANDKSGLLYSNDDALRLTVFEFTRIVLCQDLGVDGFYLYAWLKLKCKITCKKEIDVYYNEIEAEVGYKERTIRKLLQGLEEAGMIKINRVTGYDKEKKKPISSNSYELAHH